MIHKIKQRNIEKENIKEMQNEKLNESLAGEKVNESKFGKLKSLYDKNINISNKIKFIGNKNGQEEGELNDEREDTEQKDHESDDDDKLLTFEQSMDDEN